MPSQPMEHRLGTWIPAPFLDPVTEPALAWGQGFLGPKAYASGAPAGTDLGQGEDPAGPGKGPGLPPTRAGGHRMRRDSSSLSKLSCQQPGIADPPSPELCQPHI